MSLEGKNSPGSQESAPSNPGKRKKKNPDLHALAERVMRLLKKEMRIELERQGVRHGK